MKISRVVILVLTVLSCAGAYAFAEDVKTESKDPVTAVITGTGEVVGNVLNGTGQALDSMGKTIAGASETKTEAPSMPAAKKTAGQNFGPANKK